MIFMSYWYGSLYVVVEGWRELNETDPKVDPLISSPDVDRLKAKTLSKWGIPLSEKVL
jgi:hypothetical protein